MGIYQKADWKKKKKVEKRQEGGGDGEEEGRNCEKEEIESSVLNI